MYWWGKKKRLLIEFAAEVAEELYQRVPPEIVEKHLSGKNKKATRRFDAAVDNAIARIADFRSKNKPGVYGKAKIYQVFAQRLKELGYPEELVDDINAFIITKNP